VADLRVGGRRARRRRRQLLLVLATVALVLAVRARLGSDSPGGPAVEDGAASVVRVVDGDTVRVQLGGTEESVRLIGIDTPETVDPRSPVECFGEQASARTKALLPAGTEVRLVADVEPRDRYHRLLAYVYRDDGTFVNLSLVADGYASVRTYPPNVAHEAEFTSAAAEARDEGRGLWGACGGPDDAG
jgi:endonuclease YncB( thermonuclease family)